MIKERRKGSMTNTAGIRTVLILSLLAPACASRVAPGPGPEKSGVASAGSSAATTMEIARLAVVSDSTGIARKLRSACSDPETRSRCYESQLVPLASKGQVKLAMGALAQLGMLDADVRTSGHVYAHAIGIAAGKAPGDVAAAFTQCSESFQSGCYHGVIQAWFARLDSIGPGEANGLCQPFRENEGQRWIRFQCVHGMGHGLTMLYKHDLTAGLEGCDLLADQWDRHACYGGAFMENIVNVTIPHHPASAMAHDRSTMTPSTPDPAGHDMSEMSHAAPAVKFKAVDPSNQQYPCSIMAERYLRSCYEMQTSVMLYNNGGDMAGAARDCNSAPQAMRTVCYSSLGRDVSSRSQQNHAEAIRMCSLGTPAYQPWCYFGVVKNFVDLNARAQDGIAFCRAIPGDANKQLCYAAVGEQIHMLAPSVEGRRRMCAESEGRYVDACLYGSRVIPAPPDDLVRVWSSIEN